MIRHRAARFAMLAAAAMLIACEQQPVPEYSIQQFLGTTSFAGASFSPENDKVLVSSNESGIFNAYAIPTGGGAPERLTNSTEQSIFALGFFPNDQRFLYTADQGGNELNHVYVRELDGSVRDLTPGEGHRAFFSGWARDDQTFFVATNERDSRYNDLYEVDPASYERELIYRNDAGYGSMAVSPNRRWLALGLVVSGADSDIYLHDRETGETELITPSEGDVTNGSARFSRDGRSLYFITDENSEFAYLVRMDLDSREREVVEQPEWDVMFSTESHDGTYLVVGINNDARTELHVYETETMTPVSLPEMPSAEVTSVRFSRDETMMAFYASSSRMPQDLFVVKLGSAEPVRLTNSLNEAIDAEHLVDGRVVRFASYDGVEIPGVLYRPKVVSVENRSPAIVSVHGGPGGQSRVGYSAVIQYLVNHGYVVYAINNRGSSGYGKTFFHLDDRKHGDADLDDVVASKTMLIETGYVDPDRIGILGGSYGGYMVLAALAFRPEEFAVGVDLFGISNWHRTVTNIPPWWESFRKSLEDEMGEFDNEDFFRAKSPLFHADQIVRPLMVLQGANDPRVLKAESDEIVAAVRANGVPVEYVLFDDEGHGFRKKENQEKAYEAILAFLDKYLKGAGETDIIAAAPLR